MSKVFFMENPLMDLSKEYSDDSILTKYELAHGQACLANEKQLPIYDELFKTEGVEIIPGGSTLNSCRAFHFLAKEPQLCSYFGCVGEDEFGKVLENTLVTSGINAQFHKTSEAQTGTCACIIIKNERALCANLSACLKYPTSHFDACTPQMDQGVFLYTSAFFISSNFEALMKMAQLANAKNIPFGFNLSAVFLIQFELPKILEILPYVDFLFANEDEGAAFAESQGWKYADLAMELVKFRKINEKRNRVVVITQGPRPTMVGEVSGYREIEQIPLEKEKIVDTNGAGDSFVGGFLFEIYRGNSVDVAVKTGSKLAREVVMRSGCTFPANFEI